MLAALLLTAALTTCQIERAQYVLRTEPAITAGFMRVEPSRNWPSGLALRIDIHGRRHWFVPFPGGTDGAQNLASTLDPTAPGWTPPNPDGGPRPLGNFQYLGFDAAYLLLQSILKSGGTAPAHILLPTLDDALRHPAGDRPRDSIPRQFFDLVACGDA